MPFVLLDCGGALGVENGIILSSQITSSEKAKGGEGRLGGDEWCSHIWFPWIRVDLGTSQTVIGVIIESIEGYYVTSIRVQTGFDVNSMQYILANDGKPKVSV